MFESNTRNGILSKKSIWKHQSIVIWNNDINISRTIPWEGTITIRVVYDKMYSDSILKIERIWGWNKNCNRVRVQTSGHDVCWPLEFYNFVEDNRQTVRRGTTKHQITVGDWSVGLRLLGGHLKPNKGSWYPIQWR